MKFTSKPSPSWSWRGTVDAMSSLTLVRHGQASFFAADYQAKRDDAEHARNFQRMFEALTLHWQSAEAEGVEGWPAFRGRVQRGLQAIFDRPGQGRRVALFTSGGFIGTAVHLALGVP